MSTNARRRPTMVTPLYFVRHGATDWNVEGRLQGQRDVILNPLGRRQAAVCGDILLPLMARHGQRPTDFAYVSSPLSRARETMELIRATLKLDTTAYQLDPRLKELSFGLWEGLTLAEIGKHDQAAITARDRDKWRFVPPQGESYESLAGRVGAWLARIDRPTIAVAHGGTARSLIALLKITTPEAAPIVSIEQGVVYEFAAAAMTIHR